MHPVAPPLLVSRHTLRTEGFALLYPTSMGQLHVLQRRDIVTMFNPVDYDLARPRGGPIGYAGAADLDWLQRNRLRGVDFDPAAGPPDRRLCQILARMDYAHAQLAALPPGDPAEHGVNLRAERERLCEVARLLIPQTQTYALQLYAHQRVRVLPAPTHTLG